MRIVLTPEQKRFLGTEMVISSVLCGLLPSLVIWFVFAPFPLPVWGGGGFLVFVAKNSIGMVTVMTTIMSLVNRRKIKKGKAPSLTVSRRDYFWLRLIPPWLIIRAPVYGICAAALAVPLSLLVMTVLGVTSLSRPGFIAFNVVYGMIVGVVFTPLILIAVMLESRAITTELAA